MSGGKKTTVDAWRAASHAITIAMLSAAISCSERSVEARSARPVTKRWGIPSCSTPSITLVVIALPAAAIFRSCAALPTSKIPLGSISSGSRFPSLRSRIGHRFAHWSAISRLCAGVAQVPGAELGAGAWAARSNPNLNFALNRRRAASSNPRRGSVPSLIAVISASKAIVSQRALVSPCPIFLLSASPCERVRPS